MNLKKWMTITDEHANLLVRALQSLNQYLPISVTAMQSFELCTVALLDVVMFRFAKLQEFIHGRIFSCILKCLNVPNVDNMPSHVRLNKLHTMGFLPNIHLWLGFRSLRNYLAHEHPETQEDIALSLNDMIIKTHQILEYWWFVRGQINKHIILFEE